jgi:hypothetical protein
LFQRFEEMYPRHSWQSWRDRYNRIKDLPQHSAILSTGLPRGTTRSRTMTPVPSAFTPTSSPGGSVGPESSETPENSEDPENSNNHKNSDKPVNPEGSNISENMESPEDPETPESPEDPETPESPENLENPENFENPENSENALQNPQFLPVQDTRSTHNHCSQPFNPRKTDHESPALVTSAAKRRDLKNQRHQRRQPIQEETLLVSIHRRSLKQALTSRPHPHTSNSRPHHIRAEYPWGKLTAEEIEDNNRQIDAWIAECASKGYPATIAARGLFHTTITPGPLATIVMDCVRQREPIPDNYEGIWTDKDDISLRRINELNMPIRLSESRAKTQMQREINRLLVKHGKQGVELRALFLRDLAEILFRENSDDST